MRVILDIDGGLYNKFQINKLKLITAQPLIR